MIVSVNKNICKIQSGVNVHELQVLRGYDMSGATIHDVQLWRTRVVDLCSFPVFSMSPVFSIVMSCRYVVGLFRSYFLSGRTYHQVGRLSDRRFIRSSRN